MAETISEAIGKELQRCVDDIKRRHVAAGQVATGKTLRSLEWRLRKEGTRYIGEVLGRPFFGALETGSRPARRRGTDEERREFVRSLTEWCRVRGFPSSGLTAEQYERAANWLRWYLVKFGSKLYRSGGRRDIFTPAVEMLTKNVSDHLSLYYDELIKAEITNNFYGANKH